MALLTGFDVCIVVTFGVMKNAVANLVHEKRNFSEDFSEWYDMRNEMCHQFRAYKEIDSTKFFTFSGRLIEMMKSIGIECPLAEAETKTL